jgi:hypothetical protein
MVSAVLNLSGSSPTYGLGYKYHFKKSAIRIGCNVLLANTNSLPREFTSSSNETFSSSVFLGYQLQYSINNKFCLFYGLNGIYTYTKSDIIYTTYNNLYTSIVTSNSEIIAITNGYGSSPFLGMQYYINSRVSFSVESSFNITYNMQTNDDIYYNNIPNSITEKKQNNNYWKANFTPGSAIFINFHF